MKISIVLTTYNGAKYIEELLLSLYNQSRKPDEVIIADDCSNDETYKIVREFINKYNLNDKWKIYINDKNLGYKKNFLNCLKHSIGDYIFFCDQDDIWLEKKIEKMMQVFDDNPDAKVVLCEENKTNNSLLKKSKRQKLTGNIRKISFTDEIKKCKGAGHLMALKQDFAMEYVDFLINHDLTFDVPYAIIASVFDSLYILKETLVLRRIHDNNSSGNTGSILCKIKNRERIIAGRECRLSYFKCTKIIIQTNFNNESYMEFFKMIEILENSIQSIKVRKAKPLLIELFSSNPYLNKNISLMGFLSLFMK